MDTIEAKPPMAMRLHDEIAERRKLEQSLRESGQMPEEEETGIHNAFTKVIKTEMTEEEKAGFMANLRAESNTPSLMREEGTYRAFSPMCRVSLSPIQSSHAVGWDLKPLSKPGPYSLRWKERCKRKSCAETQFGDTYFQSVSCLNDPGCAPLCLFLTCVDCRRR